MNSNVRWAIVHASNVFDLFRYLFFQILMKQDLTNGTTVLLLKKKKEEEYSFVIVEAKPLGVKLLERKKNIENFMSMFQTTLVWSTLDETISYLQKETWREHLLKPNSHWKVSYDVLDFVLRAQKYLQDLEYQQKAPGNWQGWIAEMLSSLQEGNLPLVAHWLACSLIDEDEPTAVDAMGERMMFTRPELNPHYGEVWGHMVPMITPECIGSVKSQMSSYGWRI